MITRTPTFGVNWPWTRPTNAPDSSRASLGLRRVSIGDLEAISPQGTIAHDQGTSFDPSNRIFVTDKGKIFRTSALKAQGRYDPNPSQTGDTYTVAAVELVKDRHSGKIVEKPAEDLVVNTVFHYADHYYHAKGYRIISNVYNGEPERILQSMFGEEAAQAYLAEHPFD